MQKLARYFAIPVFLDVTQNTPTKVYIVNPVILLFVQICFLSNTYWHIVLRTLMNTDRNVPLNLTALGFDENEDVDQFTIKEAASAVKVII